MPRFATSRRAPRGFTLIELLVVVSILAIMLTLSVMSLDWLLPDTRLASGAREIASFVEDARDEAILRGRTVRLEYQLGEKVGDRQSFRSILDPEPGQENDFEDLEFELTLVGWRSPPDGVRIAALMVDEEDEITNGFYSFAAQSNGTITPHTVQLYSEEIDSWYSVRVAGLLGEAQVEEGRLYPQFLQEDTF